MPKMVLLKPNPRPTDAQKKVPGAKDILADKPRLMDFVTAMENVRLTDGLYVIEYPDEPKEPEAPAPRDLEDYSADELKVMMLTMGVKTEKKMKREDIITLIRTRLAEIEVEE